MEPKDLILNYGIPHECKPGQCSGGHLDGGIEIPSVIFVDACTITPKRYDGTPQAPD